MEVKTLQVQRQKDVWVVTFLEVAFTPDVISDLHSVLTLIESTSGPSAIVFASAAKAFSGGLNLKYITSAIRAGHRDIGRELLALLMGVLARLLVFPVPTVAAIAGHCYAGGMAFACACDHRVMSESGAVICMNEIDINIAPPQGVISVVMAKTPSSISKDLFLTGRKMTAQEALAGGVIDSIVPKSNVLQAAIDLGQSLADIGTRRTAYRLIKLQLNGHVADICTSAKFVPEQVKLLQQSFAKL